MKKSILMAALGLLKFKHNSRTSEEERFHLYNHKKILSLLLEPKPCRYMLVLLRTGIHRIELLPHGQGRYDLSEMFIITQHLSGPIADKAVRTW